LAFRIKKGKKTNVDFTRHALEFENRVNVYYSCPEIFLKNTVLKKMFNLKP